jgi:hypothetical protein
MDIEYCCGCEYEDVSDGDLVMFGTHSYKFKGVLMNGKRTFAEDDGWYVWDVIHDTDAIWSEWTIPTADLDGYTYCFWGHQQGHCPKTTK